MSRAIHCTVVEVPAMSDFLGSHAGGPEDLVPWADPYIAALMEKLRRFATVTIRSIMRNNPKPRAGRAAAAAGERRRPRQRLANGLVAPQSS